MQSSRLQPKQEQVARCSVSGVDIVQRRRSLSPLCAPASTRLLLAVSAAVQTRPPKTRVSDDDYDDSELRGRWQWRRRCFVCQASADEAELQPRQSCRLRKRNDVLCSSVALVVLLIPETAGRRQGRASATAMMQESIRAASRNLHCAGSSLVGKSRRALWRCRSRLRVSPWIAFSELLAEAAQLMRSLRTATAAGGKSLDAGNMVRGCRAEFVLRRRTLALRAKCSDIAVTRPGCTNEF